MRLTDYLDPALVVLGLSAEGTEDTLAQLAAVFPSVVPEASPEAVTAALVKREQVHTTVITPGVAIPHGTVEGLKRMHVILGISPGGIPFCATKEDPVHVFFTILSPAGREAEHIKLLARVSRLIGHPGFIDDVRTAGSPDDVLAVVARVDQQHF
jgi:PTS system nitrogen regulatory IIA component